MLEADKGIRAQPPNALQRLLALIERRPILMVVALAFLLAVPGLGSGYLWDRDETWYAGCALNMVLTGDWLVPRVGDRLFLEKPPLAYWLMAVGFKTLGVSEFAARVPSAIVGAMTLAVVTALGMFWINRRVGLIAAGVLGTSLLFAGMSRMALTDPALVLGIAAALACYWRMEEGRDRATSYALLCFLGGVGVGIAVMAKGPLGLLPGVIALIYMIARRDFSFLARARWALLLGIVGILLVAAPWYVAIWRTQGEEFYREFVVQQNISRFGDPIQGHSGPFFYYIPVLLLGLLPWSFYLVAAPVRRRPLDRFDLFLAIWVLFPFVMFSAMSTKLPHYMAPALPALAILIAREIDWRLRDGAAKPRWVATGSWIMGALGAVMVVLGLASDALLRDVHGAALWAPGAVLAGGFAWALVRFHRAKDHARACLIAGAATIAGFLAITLVSLPLLVRIQVINQVTIDAHAAAIAATDGSPQGRLFTFAYFEPSLFYYSDGAMETGREPELHEFLARVPEGATAWIICRDKHEDNVLRIAGPKFAAQVTPYEALDFRNEWLSEKFRKKDRFRLRLVEITSRNQPQMDTDGHR